jgi:phosphohistidine phosphatase
MEAERRVVLVRHAKSTYPPDTADHDRPLSGRGRRNAQAAGRWFVAHGPRIGLVLCSDATRARHTWEIIRAELVQARLDAPVQLAPVLYGASPAEVITLLSEVPDDVGCVVVVGHEPTMSGTALLLAGEGSASCALSRLRDKFATNAVAVLRLDSSWDAVGPASCALESFTKPRG